MVTAEFPDEVSSAELSRCRRLAQSLGLDKAIQWHTDYLPDEKSLDLLKGCDVVVLPHRETPESASGAVRTAMASRRPIIVTPVKIFEEMSDTVIRAAGLEAADLASVITATLRDQNLRKRTVDEADRWLEAHNWARMSERLYGMICSLQTNRSVFASVDAIASGNLPSDDDPKLHSVDEMASAPPFKPARDSRVEAA